MLIKLPIKLIPWPEKSEKHTLSFAILICLLSYIYRYSIVDVTEGSVDKNLPSLAKVLCKILAFLKKGLAGYQGIQEIWNFSEVLFNKEKRDNFPFMKICINSF